MIRKKTWFPVIYMFVVTALLSSVVIGFTKITNQRVQANAQLAFEKAVLTVMPNLMQPNLTRLELHNLFTEKISEPDDSSCGAYILKQNGKIIAYALPFSGQGFWAPVKGVIGIKADKKTITGIAFYEQNETPGLGAEIAKISFTKQFDGKELSADTEAINIRRPAEPLGKSDVHAVTGATQTSTRLEKFLNDALNEWRQCLEQHGEN